MKNMSKNMKKSNVDCDAGQKSLEYWNFFFYCSNLIGLMIALFVTVAIPYYSGRSLERNYICLDLSKKVYTAVMKYYDTGSDIRYMVAQDIGQEVSSYCNKK